MYDLTHLGGVLAVIERDAATFQCRAIVKLAIANNAIYFVVSK